MAGNSEVHAQLILAPHAKVDMTGNDTFKGMIISKAFEMGGNATVELVEPFIINGPISPAALASSNENNGSSGPADSEIIETGARPSLTRDKIREETK